MAYVQVQPDGEYERFGSEYVLPSRFTARIEPEDAERPICHLRLTLEGGRVECDEVSLERRPGSRRIGSADLRVPLPEYVRLAVDAAAALRVPAGSTWSFDGVAEPITVLAELDDGFVATPLVGMTRTQEYRDIAGSRLAPADRQITLREVADVYTRALARRQRPTKAVMEEWNLSRSTASRWVRRAREECLLGPATPRTAG